MSYKMNMEPDTQRFLYGEDYVLPEGEQDSNAAAAQNINASKRNTEITHSGIGASGLLSNSDVSPHINTSNLDKSPVFKY